MAAGCGLFGKVRPRRDFVTIETPRPFLAAWEPWLQAGLAASRATLGDDWHWLFLTAPIWRFWLGAELCGSEAVGAIMPSIDGAGRCFPLTVLACCPQGEGIAAPDRDPLPDWFGAAEAFLLMTLGDEVTFEAIRAGLGGLPPPPAAPENGGAWRGASLWWTTGGEASGPARFRARGLPAPEAMTAMIGRATEGARTAGMEAHHDG